jgi:cysteine desulfurase
VANHTINRILLDAASAPLHPQARETLLAAVDSGWADPRRLYAEARTARRLLDQAREVVAAGLRVRPAELSFTPGGPEAVAVTVDGLLHAGRRHGARLVASAVEHSAVLVPGRRRAAQDTDALAEVGVDRRGRVDLGALRQAVSAPGTVAVAVQHANGEVGTLQPLDEVHEVCRVAGVPLAVDAQASLGRVEPPHAFDVLAGDARSWGGPGGLGVLVTPERTRWSLPRATEGAEGGASGYVPWVPLALAAAEAWQQTESAREADSTEAWDLVEQIRAAATQIPGVDPVGDAVARLPHIVTFSVLYADGEALVHELDRRGIAVASGSACTASTLEPSHVLAAMGALTHGNLRVTLPVAAVAPERAAGVRRLVDELPAVVASVRAHLGADRL